MNFIAHCSDFVCLVSLQRVGTATLEEKKSGCTSKARNRIGSQVVESHGRVKLEETKLQSANVAQKDISGILSLMEKNDGEQGIGKEERKEGGFILQEIVPQDPRVTRRKISFGQFEKERY